MLKKYWWVGVAIPIVSLSFLIIHFSVSVPFWDSWEMVPFFQKQNAGTLGFSDFWMQHNEHRILFPNFLMYGLAQLTHWDVYYETIVNLVLGIGILSLILVVIRRTFKKNQLGQSLSSVLAAWLILSPVQWENWLWGWQIEWFLSILAIIFTFWCLTVEKISSKLFVWALLSSTIATFSLANGQIIWGIGLLVLIIKRQELKRIVGWLSLGLIEVFLYYQNYINPPYHPSKTLFLEYPISFVRYVLSYIGTPMTYRYPQAYLFGILLLTIFTVSVVYIWFQKRSILKTSLLAWLCVATYSLTSALLTAISRLGLGMQQSYSSRYTTISVLFVLSTFIIAFMACQTFLETKKWSDKSKATALILLIIVFFVPTLFNYAKGTKQLIGIHHQLKIAQTCALKVQSPEDTCLRLLYPNKLVVWERIQFLRTIHWSGQ